MDIGTAIPAELLTAAVPLGRGPPDVVRPPGSAAGANAALAPFDLLLQMLGNSLPGELPGGETLPTDTDASSPDELAADSAATAALSGFAPSVPLVPLPSPPLSASTSGVAAAGSAPIELADALRLAFALGSRPSPAIPVSPPVEADTLAAATGPATGTDALSAAQSGGPPQGEPSAARSDRPLDLAALSLLDPAARAPAQAPLEPFDLRPRAAPESRARAASATPAERALSLAGDLARAAETQARADGPLTRAVDGHAPVAAAAPPDFLKTARLESLLPLQVDAPVATFDPTAAPAPPALHGPGGTQAAPAAQLTAQLPAQLGSPVDANAARWEDALASRIQWLVDHKVGEAQIKLNPPELGALDVKISLLDDKTYVQMTAHTPAARDELSQSLPRLRELMSAGGLDLGGATVSGGRDDRSGYQAATHPVARVLPFAAETADVAPSLLHGRFTPASRIDIFA